MSDRLLLVPLEDVVVFPGMSVTLAVDTGDEGKVLLVPRHEQEFANVGTVAEVAEQVRLPGGARAVALQGLHRGIAGAAHTMPDGRLYVEVEERPDETAKTLDGRTRNQQREYFLRKQMESIRKELGEDDASIVEEYETKIVEAGMPEAAREQAEKELRRLERMGEQTAESSVIRTYLDWLISVPWSERSE